MDLMSMAQLLGNFGELLGAIAVFATLFYLTQQVRQTNVNHRADAVNQIAAGFQDLMKCFREDPELCDLIRAGFYEWETLSKNDRARLHAYWGDLANHTHNGYKLEQEGVLPEGYYRGWEDNLLSAITTDGLSKYWQENISLYPSDFVAQINSRLADPATLPPKFDERFSFWDRD